jgi:hypothetical protein
MTIARFDISLWALPTWPKVGGIDIFLQLCHFCSTAGLQGGGGRVPVLLRPALCFSLGCINGKPKGRRRRLGEGEKNVETL